jgi:hypothetical protein
MAMAYRYAWLQRGLFFILLFALQQHSLLAADKTDVVIMLNGDRFIGEIKMLEFGQLQFKASYMADSVNLDWLKVMDVQSVRHFRVEFQDGSLRIGVIRRTASAPGSDFTVVDPSGITSRGALEVITIEPLEGSFLRRLRGSADVGFSFQPEADDTQLSANLSAEYPGENFRTVVQASSLFSSKEGSENTVRDSIALTHYQFLSRNSFIGGLGGLLKDNQLNLDLRAMAAVAPGHFFVHTNRTGFAAFAGLASAYEKYFDVSSSRNGNKAEALAGFEFYTVRFASSQVNTTLLFFSGLTEKGRRRVDWQSSISWKFWKDLYWKMTALENFDSRPPEGAHRNDFSLTTSFGLTF